MMIVVIETEKKNNQKTSLEETIREELIAQLSQIGYDGFEELGTTLKAYVTEDIYVEIINLFVLI